MPDRRPLSLASRSIDEWERRIGVDVGDVPFAPTRGLRQPVHTVYESADLFTPDRVRRLGEIARETMDRAGPDADAFAEAVGLGSDVAAAEVYRRVRRKLEDDPVEDLRLDFEDGYRGSTDTDEDRHARSVAEALAVGMGDGTLPPAIGVRVKSLGGGLLRRSLRTLDLVMTGVVERAGSLPPGFRVTLPKITGVDQVAVLDQALSELEATLGISRVPIELMVETAQLVVDEAGTVAIRRYVEAGGGRVLAAHLGVYDYTTMMDVAASHQAPSHPAAEFARRVMAAGLAGTGVWLSDGSTNLLPVGDAASVRMAWRRQFSEVRAALRAGYYQGWDLHPGQLPSRFAAVFSFFLESIEEATDRLRAMIESAASTAEGAVYDDPATGESLLRFVLRAVECGAVDAGSVMASPGLTLEEVEGSAFATVLQARR